MNALDTLAAYGSELTTEQLDDVDGGLFLLIMGGVLLAGAVGFGVGYVWGEAAAQDNQQQQCTCP